MTAFDRRIKRRDFLKAASLGTTATALAACVPTTTPGSPAAPASQAPGASPSAGSPAVTKTVRFAMTGKVTSADTADPHFATTTHDGRLASAVYEQLARFDESLQAIPQLAESWEPNADASEWTFKLRSGVMFHDGDPFTAKDVVFSYQRILDPALKSPGAGNLAAVDADGIEAVDDLTVRFKLKSANVDFPLSTVFRQAFIVRDGSSGDDLKAEANGTGPFVLDSFTPGETPTVFVKNPDYWEEGKPIVDAIELTAIPEGPSRVAALQRDQVDIIEEPPATDYEGLKNGADTTIVTQLKGNMELIAMTVDTPPFDNLKLRQAMKYVIDRQRMVDLLVGGYGTLVNDIPISSELQYAVEAPPRPHDVAMAKQLLSEAGYPNGLTVKLAVSDVQARFVEFATVYQQLAAEAGLTIELDVRPADTYWDVVWLKEPMYVSAYIARPTDGMLALLYLSDAEWNETHWRDPEWDALLAKARATLEVNERTRLYQQAQQQLIDEGGHLVPYMTNTIDATRKTITGWTPSGTPFHDFRNIDITG
jgi:peptide/nickel transport system substrate-binding protein